MLRRLILSFVATAGPVFGDLVIAPPDALPANAAAPEIVVTANGQTVQPAQPRGGQTPEQQRTQLLQQLVIDRSNSGVLQARLEAKRRKEQQEHAQDQQEEQAGESSHAEAENETVTPETPPAQEPPKEEDTPSTPPDAETPEEKRKRQLAEQQQKQQEMQKKLAEYQAAIETFRADVVLGNWGHVKDYLASLPDNDAKIAFNRVAQQLAAPVTVNPRPELATLGVPGHPQDQYLRSDEILAFSDAAKDPPDKSMLANLANLIDKQNPPPRSFFAALEHGTRWFGLNDEEARHRTAEFLLNARFLDEAAAFLPDREKAREANNSASLNLISRFHAEAHRAEKGREHLPLAWELCLAIIAQRDADLNERGEALYRALSLVPDLEGEAGKAWLTRTFAEADGEGFEILAAVGTLASQTRNHSSPDFRLEQLELQAAAVAALLGRPEIDLEPWREILTIYARNWNAEAERTQRLDRSTTMRPQMQFDNFGNIYYVNMPTNYTGAEIPPIQAGDVLRCRPGETWLAEIDPIVRLESIGRTAELFLKVKEEGKAFPLLRALVAERPDQAETLVKNMIRVWAENHNPNQQSQYRSSYYYYYGSNPRAESIPLTRSKQERNLEELAKLIDNVRGLGLDVRFEDEFADAFIQAHSQAEVWRVEALESVFGPVEALDPGTIAALLRRMRGNLANLWPNPKLQEQAQTKRRDKELEAQILFGYAAASELCQNALEKHPNDWALQVQLASLGYEESNYRASQGSHPDHSAEKKESLDALARAADTYLGTLPREDEKEESTEPFTTWFFAALGSPDLAALKAHHQPVPAEYPKIKAALERIPAECRERHFDDFAGTLNSRLANVSPDLKYRFLEAALPITGDHERIAEATKVFQYYQDLVTEIQLAVRLDGSDKVGAGQPFGLFVDLRHTKEIERESGGFQRYLVNQNNQPYAYNYGRPTEDYRDKFEKANAALLEEHFEIASLTFHASKIESRTDAELGWRYTPYAYYLLKAKGPEVDTIPPLKIDLDFLDTSGYVVLPVTSAAIPIDASAPVDPRPYRNLQLTLILDEREAEKKNRIVLEVRASAHGLVPDLQELIALPIDGFEIADTEDRDLQVEELTTETDDGAPLSTHEWRLTLKPEKGKLPATFQFPEVLATVAEEGGLIRQKYEDVDLIPVEATTPLTSGSPQKATNWFLVLVLPVLLVVGLIGFVVARGKPVIETFEGPEIPRHLTPVTLLSYLDTIREKNHLPENERVALTNDIDTLQARSFGPQASPPNAAAMEEIARQWQNAARARAN